MIMDKINKFSRIILVLLLVSGVIWIGSSITRMMTTYYLFQGTQFELNYFVNDSNLESLLLLIAPAVTITTVSYLSFLFFFFLFLILSKLKPKTHGWLFISSVLVILTAPFELFLIYKFDYPYLTSAFGTGFDAQKILADIISRFTILGGFSFVELLCYFVILVLFVFQPLTMKRNKEQ